MAPPMTRALMFLLLLAAASQARAQDDAVQRVYAAMEPRIRAEYEFHLAGVARQVLGSGAPASKIELFQKRLKVLAYNRAVLVAYCIADAGRPTRPLSQWNKISCSRPAWTIRSGSCRSFLSSQPMPISSFPSELNLAGSNRAHRSASRCCGRTVSCRWMSPGCTTSRATMHA